MTDSWSAYQVKYGWKVEFCNEFWPEKKSLVLYTIAKWVSPDSEWFFQYVNTDTCCPEATVVTKCWSQNTDFSGLQGKYHTTFVPSNTGSQFTSRPNSRWLVGNSILEGWTYLTTQAIFGGGYDQSSSLPWGQCFPYWIPLPDGHACKVYSSHHHTGLPQLLCSATRQKRKSKVSGGERVHPVLMGVWMTL